MTSFHRRRRAAFASDVEEQEIFAGDDVRNAVAVVRHRAKSAAGGDAVWMLLQVEPGSLPVRRLRRRQPPGLAQDFLQFFLVFFSTFQNCKCFEIEKVYLQKWRIQFQVFRYDV